MKLRRSRRRPLRRYKPVTLRSKLKQERRKKLGKLALYGIAAGFIVLAGWRAWKAANQFLFNSECFRIRVIDIRGTKNVAQSEILALLPFREGDNIFKPLLSETEGNIRQCKPELKDISIRRGWKKIVVDLEERQPVACLMLDGQRLGIDDDNKPFPLRGKLVKEELPEIVNKNDAERKEILEFIRMFAPEAKALYPQVARFGMESVNDIVFEFKDGAKVFWGPPEKNKLKAKLRRLNQVMEDARSRFATYEYINLCYFDDGRVIVKPGTPVAATKPQPSANLPLPSAKKDTL